MNFDLNRHYKVVKLKSGLKYKDFKRKINIEIPIAFKALDPETTIYIKDGESIFEIDKYISHLRYLTTTQLILYDEYSYELMYLNFKDYGKSWALTEGELL